jgi:hypothetical protein
MALDPNVHIQEVKAFSCDIRAGRRPKGSALRAFVQELRDQAHSRREQEPRVEPAENTSTDPEKAKK